MNKKEIVTSLSEKTGLTKKDCEAVLGALTETVVEGLCAGDVVSLPGLGKFSVAERAARVGRNPQTGEEIAIDATCTAKFKVSGVLKETVKANY